MKAAAAVLAQAIILLFGRRFVSSEMLPNCTEPFTCATNLKNITEPVKSQGECFVACVTCFGSNWMCASFLNKTRVVNTGTNAEKEGDEDDNDVIMPQNATNLTEKFFECQCSLLVGGACSDWQQVCIDEGFDDIEGGYIEVEDGFIEMDEKFSVGNINALLSAMVATSLLLL
jgi:hypothetical protein